MNGQKIWSGILAGLKLKVSSSTYRTWFGGSHVLDLKKSDGRNLLVIGVKNNFIKEQVETRYYPLICELAEKGGLSGEVIFVVSTTEHNKKSSAFAPLFSGVAPTYVNTNRRADNLNPNHMFENFVVGSSNNLAYLAFTQAAKNLGSLYNPVFVYGPTGVGKTHLLQAFGNFVLLGVIDAKVLYVSAERFTNDYIESLNNRTQQAFRQKYRGVDVLLVDDIQFLAGKESTQDEFFFTFNELALSGRQLVIASDKHPNELTRVRDRLLSRFMGGMTVDINRADLELRCAIVRAKCKERGVALADEILNYIAESCESGARELEGTLIQVLTLTKLSGDKISLGEIKGTIEKNTRENKLSFSANKPKPTPGKIMEAVSRHFRISSGDLCGPTRKAAIVRARQVLMYLLRQDLGLPLEGVGEMTGGRDHSTVLYGVGKVSLEVQANQNTRDEITRIRASFQQ